MPAVAWPVQETRDPGIKSSFRKLTADNYNVILFLGVKLIKLFQRVSPTKCTDSLQHLNRGWRMWAGPVVEPVKARGVAGLGTSNPFSSAKTYCILHSYIIQQALRMFLLKSSHRPSNLQTTTWAEFSAELLLLIIDQLTLGDWCRCSVSYVSDCKREQWSWAFPCIVLDNCWTLTLCMSWWKSILSSYIMHSFSLCCHRSEQRKSDSQTNKFAVLKSTPTFTPHDNLKNLQQYTMAVSSYPLLCMFSSHMLPPPTFPLPSPDSLSLDSRPPHALTVQLFN